MHVDHCEAGCSQNHWALWSKVFNIHRSPSHMFDQHKYTPSMTNMFTFSPQTSDNQTPRGAASLMKTQELSSRPAMSERRSFYTDIKRKKLVQRGQFICSKHTIRKYLFNFYYYYHSFLKENYSITHCFFQSMNIKIQSLLWNNIWSTKREKHIPSD